MTPATATRVVEDRGLGQTLFGHFTTLSGNWGSILSCRRYLMSITKRGLIVKAKTRVAVRRRIRRLLPLALGEGATQTQKRPGLQYKLNQTEPRRFSLVTEPRAVATGSFLINAFLRIRSLPLAVLTCYAVNEEPQPQLPVAFGFVKVKPEPITLVT